MTAAIALSVALQRTSLDLLDGCSVQVAVRNPSRRAVDVRFLQPQEYAIDVLRGSDVLWTSAPRSTAQGTAIPPHVKRLASGLSVLAIYVWNEETGGGESLAPGDYIVRARLLGDGVTPQATVKLRFAAPTPIVALSSLAAGDAVTIAGRYDPASQTARDFSGFVKLSRRLTGAPPNRLTVIRGYIAVIADGTRIFSVSRWAPVTAP
ncbi:MAG: hypothetical protein M3R51_09250 [Candidatus Eremiobacteraeota bacterium]|nr:hypothetical protein [Candidatus Eremiobacteraeota bacterium]